ncbi:universal stress protein [Fundidesulfovibrio terrae]|uniref:universal stress protein n=1 Tax=Fundidesulfovibrio terrae TaxID=2922866 RepID=UPI001FAF8811|nr:universal stress protein [Fundidesulfovibrio terrae]
MNVLVAHDGSPQADKALEAAVTLASAPGGRLDIVSVVPDLCLSSEEISVEDCNLIAASLATEARGLMAKVEQGLSGRGVSAQVHIRHGRPAEAIAECAADLGSDVAVLGSHGRHGAARALLGSVSSRVAELARCNVFIVK